MRRSWPTTLLFVVLAMALVAEIVRLVECARVPIAAMCGPDRPPPD